MYQIGVAVIQQLVNFVEVLLFPPVSVSAQLLVATVVLQLNAVDLHLLPIE